VISGNNVNVVRKLIACLGAHDRREEFAADKSGAGNIERYCVAILRFESRAALAEVKATFVDDVGGKRRRQRRDCRRVTQRPNDWFCDST
jgi:hypothetical protein